MWQCYIMVNFLFCFNIPPFYLALALVFEYLGGLNNIYILGDEAVCRAHLQSFSQLAEIGFPSKDVHEALIQHSFDHQKALDQLIT